MPNYNAYAQPQQPVQSAQPKMSLNSVPVGSTIALRGKVGWSHISVLYEGDELARENENRTKIMRVQSTLPPHTRLSLEHCEVLEQDPNTTTPLGEYLNSRLYMRRNKPNCGKCYDAISKLKTPPKVYKANPDGSADELVLAEGQELAQGLDVTVFLRVYKPKNFAVNNGLAFDSVVINEAPRFFEKGGRNTIANAMAAYGLTISNKEPQPVVATEVAPIQDPTFAAEPSTPVPNGNIVTPPIQPPIAPPPGAGIAYTPEMDPSRNY